MGTAGRSQDAERFRRLYREHYPAIHGFAYRRLLDRDAAADVAAEVFLVAWRRMDQVPARPLGWLYGVAQRVVWSTNRTMRTLAQRWDDDLIAVSDHDVAREYEDRAELMRVARAVDALPAADRQVLLLTAWEGLAGTELAAALGCSRAAAAVRLHRARARLRSLTAPDEGAEPRLTQMKGPRR